MLEGLPAYGTLAIPIPENGSAFYSEGFPVRFHRSDGTEWTANFSTGQSNLREIHELRDSPYLLVIADGICYLMDVEQTTPISIFGYNCSEVVKADNGRFVLLDQTELLIVEPTGEYWFSEGISLEQIKALKLENNSATGLSLDFSINQRDEWVSFAFNLDTKSLMYGSNTRKTISEKKWWKRW